jgi:hypothetical protein
MPIRNALAHFPIMSVAMYEVDEVPRTLTEHKVIEKSYYAMLSGNEQLRGRKAQRGVRAEELPGHYRDLVRVQKSLDGFVNNLPATVDPPAEPPRAKLKK